MAIQNMQDNTKTHSDTKAGVGNHENAAYSIIIIINQARSPSLSKVIQLHYISGLKKYLPLHLKRNCQRQFCGFIIAIIGFGRTVINGHYLKRYRGWFAQTHRCSGQKALWEGEKAETGQFGGHIVAKHTFLASQITRFGTLTEVPRLPGTKNYSLSRRAFMPKPCNNSL